MLINLEGPPLKSLLCEMGGATDADQPRGATPEVYSVRWVEQLMLINPEGPPLKSLLCEMGGATDAGQPRGATPEVFTL